VILSAARDSDAHYMQRALACALAAEQRGEVPVGAVLVAADGAVLAESPNACITQHDPTAHAEVMALRAAGAKLANYRLPGTTLYASLEPCPMCAGALVHARVARIVYAAADPRTGACGSVFDLAQSPELNHRIAVTGGILAAESARLLQRFFAQRRP
jgi:tRNA(adenine34) deaminase